MADIMTVPPLVNIHPYAVESLLWPINAGGVSLNSFASAVWPAANRALFIPVTLMQPTVVKRLWCYNGSAVSGNVDMGIYDASGTRLVSIGSTGQTGTSTLQTFDIVDTEVGPGTFFIGLALDNTTATILRITTYAAIDLGVLGVYQMASAFALPSTATFATPSSAYLPLCGLSTRDLV